MRTLKILFLLVLLLLGLPLLGQSEEYLIRVSISNARLDLLQDENVIATFQVGVPKFIPKHLPIQGKITVIEKNPHWYPTKKGRELYLLRNKKELPIVVKPEDPRNAMGAAKIIIQFQNSDVNPLTRIHGTNDKESIGRKVSSGCIRMLNEDILTLIKIIEGNPTRVLFEK